MRLEDIIKECPTNNTRHDRLIKSLAATTELSPNVITIAKNAYYKIDKFEGDIDLIQMLRDGDKYDLYDWQEVPFDDCTLLIYEMKTHDSVRNYGKALSQLQKSKSLITTKTDYKNIDPFYAFTLGDGGSYTWKYIGGL